VPSEAGPADSGAFGAPPGVAAAPGPAPLGAAAGGMIEQKTYPDPYGFDSWDPESFGTLWVHLLDADHFRDVTDQDPPPPPLDEAAYAARGVPWFRMRDADQPDLPTDERLARLRPLEELDAEAGAPENAE
jgi:hypothetical protein